MKQIADFRSLVRQTTLSQKCVENTEASLRRVRRKSGDGEVSRRTKMKKLY
ncbi:MAG TPA: hypothetical protein V6D30_11365 [Leptolyngbyaceae cyanobacterium]